MPTTELRRDPNGYHPFTETHLNTACGLCARRRGHWLHTTWTYLQERPLLPLEGRRAA